ncbi:transposase DDE domain protein [Methanobrevibacter cuticularis]|uniref:Transposase DDE domain protein n=1 Tax=Methanobrevibacter cuticularis TaxID=47311 RepID=A0A166FIP8_9EURY|nr:IS4 family transposase [Methanobrevibacter cuticularis]KZX17715.1 transposase DDE domain protein [Methanobrevibacter cuticularis]
MRDLFFYEVVRLINYEKEKYVLVKNQFTKKRKMGFKDFIFYILGNNGKTSVLELDNYFKIKNKDVFKCDNMTPTKQNFSKRRSCISPEFFKDANKGGVKNLYSTNYKELSKFKGFLIFAIDGSQAKLPNTPITREEFDVDSDSLKETKTPKARISVMSDVKNENIIDSAISEMSVSESVLASEHIEKADEIIDLKKSIIIFDRGYASAELILQLLEKESYFIFRLKSDVYQKERKQMTTNDEWIDINLNRNRKQNIKNPELKAKADELDYLHLRIVNIPLKTGEIETLLTNIPEKIGTSDELKELYGERWQIEKGYDVLKNKIHIENFSAKKRINIEQDFYSQILMYNILIEYKTKCNKELKKKQKNKDCKCEYKVNINILAGKLKSNLYEMFLAPTEKERTKIQEEVHNIAKKNIIKTKTKPSTPRNKNPLANKYPYNNRKNF